MNMELSNYLLQRNIMMNSTTQCHTFQTTWYMNILWYKGFLELEYLHILYLIPVKTFVMI